MQMRTLAVAAATFLGTSPAFAGALIFEPAPQPVVTAPQPVMVATPPAALPNWTGGHVGAQLGFGRTDGDDDDDDGAAYGLHAGYDQDFGGFVLGGEVAYNWLGRTVDGLDVDGVTRLTARAGYGVGDTLLYVRGGAAHLHGDENEWGWVAGAGAEHRFTPNTTAGIEYLYHRVDDFGAVDAEVQTLNARVSFRF